MDMKHDAGKVGHALLRVLAEAGKPLGASRLARELALQGIDLQPRMVRYYLGVLDERGWTENRGRVGRDLTAQGREELARTAATERIGLASARMDEMAYRMDLDLVRRRGALILNLSRIPVDALPGSVRLLREVLETGLHLPARIALALEGEFVGGQRASYGSALIGTVCNITLSGALRAAGIPVTSRFAGLLDIQNREPRGFSHVIHYEGTTLDPALIFIKSRLTRVVDTAREGRGCVIAGFREFPAIALTEAQRVIGQLEHLGLGGAIAVGRPGRPLLGIPVAPGRVGLVVGAGLNAVAALEEAGLQTESRPLAVMHPVEEMLRPSELDRLVATSRRLHQRLAALMDNPPASGEYGHEE
jgi:hypothetical protein